MYPLPKRQAQAAMSPLKIVIEELQANECIPGRVPFGKRRGLASERIEPIAQRAARPFHMHRPGWSSAESQRGPDLPDKRRLCSSRGLTLCVNVTVSGPTHGGRPRLPVHIRSR